MASNLGDVQITVRVNKQTGELEVVKGQVTDTAKSVENLGNSSTNASEKIAGLSGSLMKLAGGAATLAFLKSAIMEAATEEEALRKLKATLGALDLQFQYNEESVKKWSLSMQELAHIGDDVAISALSKTVQRVKDLDQAMMLVQLSQNVAISSGKDFNYILDLLSRQASGAVRSMMTLRAEFGNQLDGAKNSTEALRMLAENYKNVTKDSTSATLAAGDLKRSFMDAAQEIFDSSLPAFQEIASTLGGPVLTVVKTLAVAMGVVVGEITQLISGAGKDIKVIVEGLVEIVYNLVTGRWSAAKDAAAKTFDTLVTNFKENTQKMVDISRAADKKMVEIWTSTAKSKEANLRDMSQLTAATTKRDAQEEIALMNEKIAELRRQEAIELADKMLTNQQKIDVMRRYAEEEIAIVTETKTRVADEELKSADRISQIQDGLALKTKQIQQSGLTNWKQNLDNWAVYNTDTNARISEAGQRAFESLTGAFGKSVAQMMVYGKDFASTFESLFKNLAAQIIEQLTQIALKAAILRALGVGLGGGAGGGALSSILGFAEGGRVYKPTYALIGEGGEPESVVPDSKAKDFALGVLAGTGKSGGGPSLGGGSKLDSSPTSGSNSGLPVVVNLTANINLGGGADRASVQALISALGAETAEAIAFALASKNLADRYEGRGV